MRIAMLGTKGIPAKWGGIEKYVEEVGKRLAERGHEVTVFASRWYCRDYTGDSYKGIRIIRVPALHLQATDALSNSFFAFLRILIQPFDIVHFHSYGSYFFVAPVRALGKNTVVTSHGLIDASWENPKYGGFAHRVLRTAGSIGLRRAHCVTTVAAYWKERIEDAFHVDACVLPAGLDKADFRAPRIIRERYGLETGSYLLFLGRIDPIKRVDWVSGLRSQGGLKIVIAGGAQDEPTGKYLAELQGKVAQNPRVIFTGPVTGEEKAELLSNCRFFVNPSTSEGLPITVLEAMSYGRCCVASDIPAHREIIEHGKTGFLFEVGSADAFRELVEAVSRHSPEDLGAIGAVAKNRIGGEYNWGRTTDLTEEIYGGLLDRAQAGDRPERKNTDGHRSAGA
jgi:glycosyltransferase involved in cell wall biosynthesis